MLTNTQNIAALCLALCAASCQPSKPNFSDPSAVRQATLSELVFNIIHSNLARSEACGEPYAQRFAANKAPFIDALDHTLTHELSDPLPEIVGSVLVPAVDNGNLPRLTQATGETAAMLLDPVAEPNLETIHAAVSLSNTRSVIEVDHALTLLDRSLEDPAFIERVHSLAGLAQTHDGVDFTLDAGIELVSNALEGLDESPLACEGLTLGDMNDTLLRVEGFVPDTQLGAPALAVRADVNGNPRVRLAEDGLLYAPFMDRDVDGVADVDAQGRPVDAGGQPVTLPPFGTEGARDAQGRALGPDGKPIYDYYDVKQTALSHILQLTRDGFDESVHIEGLKLLEVVLGDPVVCDDGTGTCRQYPGADHPVADVVWLLIEVARFDRALAFLDTFAVVVRDNPQLAEDLFVAIGAVLVAFDDAFDLSDLALLELVEEVLPFADDLLRRDNRSGVSTPRALMEVIHELGQTSRDFPEKLGTMVDYVELEKPRACAEGDPDLTRSTPVDYERPRYYSEGGRQVDNRSGLEQVIELLEVADCGRVPLLAGGGKSVAYVVLDLIADMSPGDVCGLIDIVTSALPDLLTNIGLRLIGCRDNAEAVADALDSLDALTRSGSLDFLIPLARVFKERDQLDLLIDILSYVAEDLRRADQGGQSVMRRALPALSALLANDTPETLFDLLDLFVLVPASDGDGSMADVMIDSLARMVARGPTPTRTGLAQDSSLALELLTAIREMVARLEARQAVGSLDKVLDHLSAYLTETQMEQGRRRLTNPNLIPLADIVLQLAQDAADLPRPNYDCYMDGFQRESEALLTGRDFATTLRLTGTLTRTTDGFVVEAWMRAFLAPSLSDPEADLYGPMLQNIAALLSTPFDADDLTHLLQFLGRALQENRDQGRELVAIFDELLRSDEQGTLLKMGRNLIEPRAPGEDPAAVTLLEIFGDVMVVRPQQMCAIGDDPVDVDTLTQAVEAVVSFIGDDEDGLGAIYDLIGRRTDHPDVTSTNTATP